MANDPNRDLLPVKEDCSRAEKGINAKFDLQILRKLSRCELEDRFLRLLDEQTHIKKLANSQEEKIKRLGTKLLRLINEKKNGKKFSEQYKETEELHLRIIELEHENYALKDKNTVLKQQLSDHSRHLLTHRSNHTSPLMTMRPSIAHTQSEIAYDATHKNTHDLQLQEAEAHIRDLNEEIKSLHEKIDYLQQNLEKNSLDSRKIKVTENIELIRLQRALKQQAIQISALQAKVKNSENNQKILKEELVKAHNENDEALHLISVKQNEILNLCSKLEERNLNRLEEDELKSRINDLLIERDCLKERSDLLMKSIGAKAEESERIVEFQKQLAEEKCKREKLEEALELLKNSNFKSVETSEPETVDSEKPKAVNRSQQTENEEKREVVNLPADFSEESECSCNKCNLFLSNCKCSQESILNPELESDTESPKTTNIKRQLPNKNFPRGGQDVAEKMKLERELQYLKDMLRSQTSRCEAQQVEIARLMYELKLNEEKCNETLQRLDWHLRIFQKFEMSEFEAVMLAKQNLRLTKPVADSVPSEPKVVQEKIEYTETPKVEENVKVLKPVDSEIRSLPTREYSKSTSSTILPTKEHVKRKIRQPTIEDNFPLRYPDKNITSYTPEKDSNESTGKSEPKSKFVDHKFLDSSDEEFDSESLLKKRLITTKAEKEDSDEDSRSRRMYESNPRKVREKSKSFLKLYDPRKSSRGSYSSRNDSDEMVIGKLNGRNNNKGNSDNYFDIQSIKITILWFKVEAESSLWYNNHIDSIFIDFTFLDINGAETETPESLPKPKGSNEKCHFNFSQTINLSSKKKEVFQAILQKPDFSLFIFKVVSDSEKYDETNDECVDVGVAVVTVRDFFNFCNKGPFSAPVKSIENTKEVIGTLSNFPEDKSQQVRSYLLIESKHYRGIRRRTFKFAPKHKYHNPDVFSVPFAMESPSYKAPHSVPVRHRAFKPKLERNYFSPNRKFFSRKKSRTKMLNKRKQSSMFSLEAPNSFFTDSRQCFKYYGLSGPQFRHVKSHRNFVSSFEDVLDSQSNVLIKNPNQYILCLYPFIFNNLKKRTLSLIRKSRFSALKRQHLINLRNERFKNKRSANNVSATDEIVPGDNEPEISKSENYQENIQPKYESTFTYETDSVKERNETLESEDEENRTSVPTPVSFNSSYANDTVSKKKNRTMEMENRTLQSSLESPLNLKLDSYSGTDISEGKLPLHHPLLYTFTDIFSNNFDVTEPTIYIPRLDYKYPYDLDVYEPLHKNDSWIYWQSTSTESVDDYEKKLDDDSPLFDKEKLRRMLEELDLVLHDKSKARGFRVSKEQKEHKVKKSKSKKKKKKKKKGAHFTLENSDYVKKKIDTAIPMLLQISKELAKITDSSVPTSTAQPPPPEPKSSFFLMKSKRVIPIKSIEADDRCGPNGIWKSTVFGLELAVTMLPNMLLQVRITSNNKGTINQNWSVHGLALSKFGGPFLFAATCPKEKKIASFLGQCKISKNQDLIFGVWTIYSYVPKFTDLWCAVETKLDVLRKKKDC